MAYLLTDRRRNPETGQEDTRYRIGWREGKTQRTMVIGFVDEKEAKRLLKIQEGVLAAGAQPPPTEPPLKPLLSGYVEARLVPWLVAEGRAASTVTSARGSAKHLDRLIGDVPMVDLGPVHVDRYIGARRAEGAKGRTIQIELNHLTQALKLMVVDGHRPDTFKVRKPSASDSREPVWHTAEQSDALLAALPWTREPAACLAIYVDLELGLRSGELLSRRWEDVRWEQGAHGALWVGPRIDGEGVATWKTKTRRNRTMPLTEGARAALESWHARLGRPAAGWVFPSAASPDKALGTFRGTLRQACAEAGVPKLHPHALRHTWATRMARSGMPRPVAQALGGWSSPAVLAKVYEHAVSELEGDALQRASLGSAPVPLAQPAAPPAPVALRVVREGEDLARTG